jgi:tRNA(Ile)-lysidine synthase
VLPEVTLNPGEEAIWDWRFRVGYLADDADSDGTRGGAAEAEGPVLVRPLGLSAYATLRREIASKLRPPARAAASLPAVWSGERLVAVPGLIGAPSGNGRFTAHFLGLKRGAA